jgi:hypothetical protein
MIEQPLLALKATGIATERAIHSDNTMTRHNDRNGICPGRGTYRATCSGVTKVRSKFTVADRGAGRNGP